MKNNVKVQDDTQSLQTCVSGSTLISECDLSIRTKKLFEQIGFTTVEDILKTRSCTLVKYRGFGFKSLAEVRGFVIKNNLSFHND